MNTTNTQTPPKGKQPQPETGGSKLPFELSDEQIEVVAAAAHEANRAYCESIGDKSQLPWDKAPDWQKESAIDGVKFHIENQDADDDASHKNWLAQKKTDGWVFGKTKDEKKKTHPCIVPFKDLPPEQQAKDAIFRETVWHQIAIILEAAHEAMLAEEADAAEDAKAAEEAAAAEEAEDPGAALQKEADEREAARKEREERDLAEADKHDEKAKKIRAENAARKKIADKENKKKTDKKKSDAKAKADKADAVAERDALEQVPERRIENPEEMKKVFENLECVVLTLCSVLLSMTLSPGQRGKVSNCVKLIGEAPDED